MPRGDKSMVPTRRLAPDGVGVADFRNVRGSVGFRAEALPIWYVMSVTVE
jgi:hypothetical protein